MIKRVYTCDNCHASSGNVDDKPKGWQEYYVYDKYPSSYTHIPRVFEFMFCYDCNKSPEEVVKKSALNFLRGKKK